MQRQRMIVAFVSCGLFGVFVRNSAADGPSAERCYDDGNGGPTICVRFDSLSAAPRPDIDFHITFDEETGIPSIELKTGSVHDAAHPSNDIDRQWRVWCKDASGTAANIGSIDGINGFNYDLKILNASGGRGATSVGTINLQPSGTDKYSIMSGGNIDTLTGDLTLQVDPITLERWPRVFGWVTGNLSIGIVKSGSAICMLGGIQPGASVIIGTMQDGATINIGAVHLGSSLSIDHVGASSILDPIFNRLPNLKLNNVNEGSGVIHLGELHPGAFVDVDSHYRCDQNCTPTPENRCGRDDVTETTQMTIDQMDGSNDVLHLPGAKLHHRGLFGVGVNGLWETLTVGEMQNGAKLICDSVVGTLYLTNGIRAGATVEIGSMAYNPFTSAPTNHGIVDLVDVNMLPQDVAGTLLVKGSIYPSASIDHGGNVSGRVDLVQNGGTFSGQATFANVSGSMYVGNLDPPRAPNVSGALAVADVSGTVLVVGNVVSGGSIEVADVSGTVSVSGSVASGGTVSTDDVTGSVSVGGSLVGALTVGGALAGSVDVGSDMSGSLTAEANTSGHIHIGGDQYGPVTVKGSLASGATVTVDGHLKGSAIINVTGTDSGRITVKKGTASATKIQAQGGLYSGSSIYANACGGSGETVQGTIWLGGATNQNTTLTMDGTVQINCLGGTMTSTGKVKLVGCPPYDGKNADICLNGTPYYGHVTQTLTCFQGNNEVPDTFHLLCVPLSSCPNCP